MLESRSGCLRQGPRESPYLECYKPIHAPVDPFTFSHFHILSWMTQNGGRYLNSDERKRCKNFVHLQWMRPSLVISSASWRVAPHCVDPEGILDWWVKTEQGGEGATFASLRDLFPSDCCVKIGRWWKTSVFFFFLSNIVDNWVVRGFGGV